MRTTGADFTRRATANDWKSRRLTCRLSVSRQPACRSADSCVAAARDPRGFRLARVVNHLSGIMSLLQLGWADKARGLAKFIAVRAHARPYSITLELTRRCNARCDYCDHWREPRRNELDTAGFVDVVRHFDPLSVTLCGGEPFMRSDVIDIAARVKALPGWRYLSIITNGWFLGEDRAQALLATGIDQVNVSLNWPDA